MLECGTQGLRLVSAELDIMSLLGHLCGQGGGKRKDL